MSHPRELKLGEYQCPACGMITVSAISINPLHYNGCIFTFKPQKPVASSS